MLELNTLMMCCQQCAYISMVTLQSWNDKDYKDVSVEARNSPTITYHKKRPVVTTACMSSSMRMASSTDKARLTSTNLSLPPPSIHPPTHTNVCFYSLLLILQKLVSLFKLFSLLLIVQELFLQTEETEHTKYIVSHKKKKPSPSHVTVSLYGRMTMLSQNI